MTYVAPSKPTVGTEHIGQIVRLTDGRTGRLVKLVGTSATVELPGGRSHQFRVGGLSVVRR